MAELVGVIASVVTLGEAARKLSRLIYSLKRAPDELLALNNEITDLNLLLVQIYDLQSDQPHIMAPMSGAIDKMNEDIEGLTALLVEYSGVRLTGFSRIKWVAERERVNHLKDCLKERRIQLNTFLTLNNM